MNLGIIVEKSLNTHTTTYLKPESEDALITVAPFDKCGLVNYSIFTHKSEIGWKTGFVKRKNINTPRLCIFSGVTN